MSRIDPCRNPLPVCAIVCVSVAMLLSSAARAACSRWDISGGWVAIQSNATKPSFTLQQTGTEIQGSGHWAYVTTYNTFPARGDDYVEANASVDGKINGDTVEFTAYWSNDTVGVYSGKIGPQGRIEGTTYDRSHPETKANWYSGRTLGCLSDEAGAPPESTPPIALGRVHAPSRPLAVDRIAATTGGDRVLDASKPALAAAQSRHDMRIDPIARVVTQHTLSPGQSVTPSGGFPPVQAPHDLLVGRLRFSQGGELVDQLRLGQPVTIECSYSVNESPNPFVHIQPWQGRIDIGADASQALEFQGETQGGPHRASVTWTPQAEGTVVIGCVLNPGFSGAEANAGNNRWDQSVLVAP